MKVHSERNRAALEAAQAECAVARVQLTRAVERLNLLEDSLHLEQQADATNTPDPTKSSFFCCECGEPCTAQELDPVLSVFTTGVFAGGGSGGNTLYDPPHVSTAYEAPVCRRCAAGDKYRPRSQWYSDVYHAWYGNWRYIFSGTWEAGCWLSITRACGRPVFSLEEGRARAAAALVTPLEAYEGRSCLELLCTGDLNIFDASQEMEKLARDNAQPDCHYFLAACEGTEDLIRQNLNAVDPLWLAAERGEAYTADDGDTDSDEVAAGDAVADDEPASASEGFLSYFLRRKPRSP